MLCCHFVVLSHYSEHSGLAQPEQYDEIVGLLECLCHDMILQLS